MKRGTIVLVAFVVVVGAIFGVSQFLQTQPPFEITIAVNPLAADWVKDAARAFNATDPIVNATRRVQVNVISISDMRVWQDDSGWTLDDHPVGWLPSIAASVDYTSGNLPFSIIEPSLARTPLVWGGFASRVNILTDDGALPLDWDTVASAAEVANWGALGGNSDWQFIKLAFNRPASSMSGVAVLLTGMANYHQTATPSRNEINNADFANWMRPVMDSVPNFQTLGSNPAEAMASRGTTVADLALLPESQWLLGLEDLVNEETMIFAYPQYQVILDFPFALWDDPQTTDDERAAAQAFADWLLSDSQQASAIASGLRPASSEPIRSDTLFASGAAYGITLEPDYGEQVQTPERNVMEQLIERF